MATTRTISTSDFITGPIDGGTQSLGIINNTLNLVLGTKPTGSLIAAIHFDALNVQSGDWTLLDTETYQTATVSSGATLHLSGSLLNFSNYLGFAPALYLNGVLNFTGSGSLSAYITGSGSITKEGSGSLVLTSMTAQAFGLIRPKYSSDFSGGVLLSGGTLELAASDAPAGASAITFGSGAQTLVLDDGAKLGAANSLVAFGTDDTVVIQGRVTSASVSGSTLTYTVHHASGAPDSTQAITFSGLSSTYTPSYVIGPTSTSVVLALAATPPISPPVIVQTPSAALGLPIMTTNLLRASPTSADVTSGSLYVAASQAAALANQFDAGLFTATGATNALFHIFDGTISVAEISYAFFTGKTTSAAGLDYLVHSTANATDLNDPYYTKFTTENRYINFAVSLAQGGSGTQAFHAAYDSLSLADTTAKAYAAVFGTAADAAKVSALLDTLVPDGLGGMETRAAYFAGFGQDGANGIGTKAAMIGFLLANSVSSGQGAYQQAEFNFLADLAHGTAQFNVDLLATYAKAPALVGAPVLDPTLPT